MNTFQSALGIGNVLAATTIMLETDTVARFANVGHFSPYRCCVEWTGATVDEVASQRLNC